MYFTHSIVAFLQALAAVNRSLVLGYEPATNSVQARSLTFVGKACFAPVTIPSRNCRIEIEPTPHCEYDYAWDQIFIKIEAGDKRQSLLTGSTINDYSRSADSFKYFHYERESEEGRYTGPLYLNDVLIITDNTITLSNYVSNEYVRTVTCDLL